MSMTMILLVICASFVPSDRLLPWCFGIVVYRGAYVLFTFRFGVDDNDDDDDYDHLDDDDYAGLPCVLCCVFFVPFRKLITVSIFLCLHIFLFCGFNV